MPEDEKTHTRPLKANKEQGSKQKKSIGGRKPPNKGLKQLITSLFLGEEPDYRPYYIFAVTFLFYIGIIWFFPSYGSLAISKLVFILKALVWPFVFIFVLMWLVDFFVDPKQLAQTFKAMRGWKLWILSILAGIISTGPIYMWYPLLARLKDEAKLRTGYIAAFLYARAIKIPLFPLLILYFGWAYSLALTGALMVFAFFEGVVIDWLMPETEKGHEVGA